MKTRAALQIPFVKTTALRGVHLLSTYNRTVQWSALPICLNGTAYSLAREIPRKSRLWLRRLCLQPTILQQSGFLKMAARSQPVKSANFCEPRQAFQRMSADISIYAKRSAKMRTSSLAEMPR